MDPRNPTEPYGHWTERNELDPGYMPSDWQAGFRAGQYNGFLRAVLFIVIISVIAWAGHWGLSRQAQAMEWEQV